MLENVRWFIILTKKCHIAHLINKYFREKHYYIDISEILEQGKSPSDKTLKKLTKFVVARVNNYYLDLLLR